jgi:hypothetical protein
MDLKNDKNSQGIADYFGSDLFGRYALLILYAFFFIHMAVFGGIQFYSSYLGGSSKVGAVGVAVYLIFYLRLFGQDEVKWMLINAALGIFGIYGQIGFLLSLFGKKISDYSYHAHLMPFLYFMLYTFLIRRLVVDLVHWKFFKEKQQAEYAYIALSVFISILSIWYVH